MTHSYWELLRRYGLIPSVGAPAGRAATGAHCPRQILNVPDFESWKAVLNQPRDFIRALYSPERVNDLLGQRTGEELTRLAVAI